MAKIKTTVTIYSNNNSADEGLYLYTEKEIEEIRKEYVCSILEDFYSREEAFEDFCYGEYSSADLFFADDEMQKQIKERFKDFVEERASQWIRDEYSQHEIEVEVEVGVN
jgi:chromosome segregation and condensation protein ScpB